MKETVVPGLYRAETGVLVSKDDQALKAYKKRKERELKFNETQKEIVEMKKEIKEIKHILEGLIK
jgi:peptidoglycan hydrolase CwlO-like protein